MRSPYEPVYGCGVVLLGKLAVFSHHLSDPKPTAESQVSEVFIDFVGSNGVATLETHRARRPVLPLKQGTKRQLTNNASL